MKQFYTCIVSIMVFISFAMVAQSQHMGDKGHGGEGGPCGMHNFKAMDLNKDGKVSLEEWQKWHEKRFKEMDKNGDNFLTEDEKQGHMHGEHQGPTEKDKKDMKEKKGKEEKSE